MKYIIFVVFIGVPILEIFVFILVGNTMGIWPTLVTIITTAIIGTSLLRHQGLSVFFEAQKHLHQGQLPVEELFDGLCLIFAGALLLTPGFVTDSCGFLLFIPPFRRYIKNLISTLLVARGGIHLYTGNKEKETMGAQGTIIDGDFEEIETDTSSKVD
jgi:UPF0716 protein FxsA